MSANSYDGVKHVHKWSHKVDVLTPLLAEDGEFTLRGAGVPYDHPNHAEVHGLVQKFQRLGLIRRVGREHIDKRTDPDDTTTTLVNIYEWNPEARAELQAIREQSDTLRAATANTSPVQPTTPRASYRVSSVGVNMTASGSGS